MLAIEARVARRHDELQRFVAVSIGAVAVPELMGSLLARSRQLLVKADYKSRGFDTVYRGRVLYMQFLDFGSGLYFANVNTRLA